MAPELCITTAAAAPGVRHTKGHSRGEGGKAARREGKCEVAHAPAKRGGGREKENGEEKEEGEKWR